VDPLETGPVDARGFWGLEPERWREDVLRIVLRLTLALGVVVYVPSMIAAWSTAQTAVAVVDTFAILVVALLNFWSRGAFFARAAILCGVFYTLGVVLLMTVGPIAQIYLFGFSLAATLLLGIRLGLASVALNAGTMLGLGVLGQASPAMAVAQWPESAFLWWVITANFLLVNAILALALGAIVRFLERALLRERGARGALETERRLLQLANEDLLDVARDRERTAERLEVSEGRFRELADHVGELFYSIDAETGELLYVNRLSQSLWGASFEELREDRARFGQRAHPDDGEAVEREWRAVLEGEPRELEYRVHHPASDTPRTVLERAFPVRDADGRVRRVVGVARDVTADRASEAERRSLGLQIQQAQKMEAIGRLAGGIAHDFNNMLGVILGYASMVRDALGDSPRLVSDVGQIIEAGERSASLTAQLLAFARRQPIAPRDLDLDTAVEATLQMVSRLVGESVEVSFRPGGAGTVRMDPSQLDQIVVNLAINARDAMPEGGHLVFETSRLNVDESYRRAHAEVREGEFALLIVSDDGRGMDAATRDRLFEPFFTTKEAGEGTGLGLSTVYGVVKQNGGMIGVYSELGCGTTFRIYFPVAPAEAAAPAQITPAAPVGGDETVLLVEDEPRVRAMTERLLADLGYRVLSASLPSEALEVAASHEGPIHLLLTDVVMPEMSGRDVWERLAGARPELRCVFMSGYTADILGARGVMHGDVQFLAKPFTADALASKIREALRN
jgi:two-component system, cell cycle sensor histidine kinase and response regulator CckA